jgi:virginiamycin B lyase
MMWPLPRMDRFGYCTEIRRVRYTRSNLWQTHHIDLGEGSAPHGVIVGPDEAPWITDGGLNAIVRVDPITKNVTVYSLPKNTENANLNTASFDHKGILWFTGQSGIYGRLDPNTGKMGVCEAPRGNGPYGISTTPGGHVYFVSLAGSYLAQIDLETGNVTIINPPQPIKGLDVSGPTLQVISG